MPSWAAAATAAAWHAAGAGAGIAEGSWRVLRGALLGCKHRRPALAQGLDTLPLGSDVPQQRWQLQWATPLPWCQQQQQAPGATRPLLNIVIAGDDGTGTESLALALAHGQAAEVALLRSQAQAQAQAEPESEDAQSGVALIEAVVDGQPATVSVWHLGGRAEAFELGPGFYRQADGFLLVYDQDSGLAAAVAALDFLAATCLGQSWDPADQPASVVACCPAVASTPAQWQQRAATLDAVQHWCKRHAHTPHYSCCECGPQESAAALRQAFGELLRKALHRRRQAAGSLVCC